MKHILIIDDSFIMRNWVKKLLNKENFNFIEAANGKEALEALENHNIDLVFLDLLMPQYDGIFFLDSIKNKNMLQKIIVLSADIQDTTRKKILSYGVAGFLNKPPKEEELQRLMNNILV
ncbi:MAG: response regulator [Candidatus Marinimicrobia bacterium]|nr:response regulator [Candidatus Neomarinimicrobiota bacterium]